MKSTVSSIAKDFEKKKLHINKQTEWIKHLKTNRPKLFFKAAMLLLRTKLADSEFHKLDEECLAKGCTSCLQ